MPIPLGELSDLVLVLAIAALVPLLSDAVRARVRVPGVVLEIALGIVVGPSLLGWVSDEQLMELVANFGLAMLMFLAGYEIDFLRLRGKPLTLALAGWVGGCPRHRPGDGSRHLVRRAVDIRRLCHLDNGDRNPATNPSGYRRGGDSRRHVPPGRRSRGRIRPGRGRIARAPGAPTGANDRRARDFAAMRSLGSCSPRPLKGRAVVGNRWRPSLNCGPRRLLLLGLSGWRGAGLALSGRRRGLIFRSHPCGPSTSCHRRSKRLHRFGFFIPVFFVVSGSGSTPMPRTGW